MSGRHRSIREPVVDEAPSPGPAVRRAPERSGVLGPASQLRQRVVRRDARAESDEAVDTPRPRAAPTGVPWVIMDKSEIVDLPLDHRAGFVLGLCDGKTNVQSIVDISGMQDDEVVRVLEQLLLFGVIGVRG